MTILSVNKHTLKFKFEAGTSRGILTEKDSYFIKVVKNKIEGVGEASPLKGLSIDDLSDFENVLNEKISQINQSVVDFTLDTYENITLFLDSLNLNKYPSIRFALETAFLDLMNGGRKEIFKCDFNNDAPISINGLVWMGEKEFMLNQINEKIHSGFTCVKIKVGAIELEKEFELLNYIRKHYTKKDIEIRIDANGAFNINNALQILKEFSKFDIHSVEQPIKQGQINEMRIVCENSPIPVALDEELIGVFSFDQKCELLKTINPQYIILKPTLLGGFYHSEEWIKIAESLNIGWWLTSALESNIGLNAIAQFASKMNVKMPQGLGTGNLFENNISFPLTVEQGCLFNK